MSKIITRRNLAIFVISLATLAGAWAYPAYQSGRWHGFRYRYTGNVSAFKEAVRRGVRNGESGGMLTSLLGPGRQEQRSDLVRDMVKRAAILYPDGYQEGDRVVVYDFKGVGVPFHFRNDRLINENATRTIAAMLAGPGQ